MGKVQEVLCTYTSNPLLLLVIASPFSDGLLVVYRATAATTSKSPSQPGVACEFESVF